MSRIKNAVNVMMKNYMDVCLGSLIFWLVGYGLMFGEHFIDFFGASHFALFNISAESQSWNYTVLLFQIMFAATAVTICS